MTNPKTVPLLSPRDIADILQVSLRTVRRLIKSKKIKILRIGASIRVTPSALEAYLTGVASQ